jgi:hypothetical protein
MTGFGLALAIIFVPEIKQESKEDPADKEKMTFLSALRLFNPLRIFRQWVYPNIFFSVSSRTTPKTRYYILQKANKQKGFDLRPPSNIPILSSNIRPLNLQPKVPPHNSPCLRPLLPCPRSRISNRQHHRRETVRPHCAKVHRPSRLPIAPGPM